MTRNLNRPTASTREPKTNGGDRVVRTLRVFASGRVVPGPGRPPKNWGAIVARARAHALPDAGPSDNATVAPPRVKNPAKVAAGKARAEKARLAKLAAQTVQAPEAAKPAAKAKPAKKAAAKAPSKPKAKPAAKAKAKPAKAPAKRGGARAGSGPKPKGDGPMKVAAFRLTPSQIKKLEKLGGVQFIRDRIDRAAV